MAITWIFDFEGERSYVQRQDGPGQIAVLTWSALDQKTMIVRTDHEAVQLIHALEQELESRGWALIECCPERRHGEDRRNTERSSPDRRRHVL